jgi:hypothetical protein
VFRNKSDVETPWDSFVRAMEPILNRVSRRFRQQHGRRLAMGAATRIDTPDGDAVRFPIEVRGGDQQYAVATVLITGQLKRFYDEGILERIARDAVAEADKYPTSPPPKPGQVVLRYP